MTTTLTASTSRSTSHDDSHATCAWCRTDFPTIKALFAHVDNGHEAPAVLRRGFVKAA